MADDALSPVRVSGRVTCRLKPPLRYAVDQACAEQRLRGEADIVRLLIIEGLRQLGWDEARIIGAYARYGISCIEQGQINAYETGRT